MLTPALLQRATGCRPEDAEKYAHHLDQACKAYRIDTPARLAAFLAQVGHESGALRYVREIWGPTEAQRRYEGRADLGNTQEGDGRRFMGRGLIQTTGRHNYRAVRDRLRGRGFACPDFEADPAALESPTWACWSAADYWDWRGLNALADRGDFETITRRINGGLNGHADRLRRLQVAREALADQFADVSKKVDPPNSPGILDSSAHLVQPGPEPADYHAPTGEAPEWVPPSPPKEPTMAPFIAAALPAIVQSIPQLAKLFGSGSEVAQRNIAAAETVVGIVQQAVGASNAQEAAELVQSDPQARAKAQAAIEGQWYTLTTTEAGGGGIGGARQFAVQAGASSPQVWRIVGVVTYAALAFLLLANVIAMVAWGVAMWRGKGIESATQILVQVIAADILSATSAISFWLGSSFGSRQKDEQRA